MNSYLEEARKFLREAEEEFERGKRDSDPVRIRDAAEKAWNCVVQATNALFEKKGLPVPQSHFDRRKGLAKLAEEDRRVRELGLRDRFAARSQTLHEECFYQGICPLELIEEDLIKVREYLKDIEGI